MQNQFNELGNEFCSNLIVQFALSVQMQLRNLSSVTDSNKKKRVIYFGDIVGNMETLEDEVTKSCEGNESESDSQDNSPGQSWNAELQGDPQTGPNLAPDILSSETASQTETTSDCEDEDDVHYICTVAKTSIPVSVIRLAPPSSPPKSETRRPSVIKVKSVDFEANSAEQVTLNSESLVSFPNPFALNDAIRIECNLCGKKFTQQRNYNYHMAQHNGSQLFACTCPICGKSYRNKGYLSNHLKIHRNAKEYRCEWCSKSFNQRVAYNTHIRVHTGYCPHKCPLCDKAFSRKTVLTSHIRTHTGEKPFKCSMCEKAFVDKSNMLTHQRLHTGEKPFRCHICGKSFTQRNHLKTHINYHVGIKPYHCNKCNARFSQSSNLKMHSLKCTGILRASSFSDPESTPFVRTTPMVPFKNSDLIQGQIFTSKSGMLHANEEQRVSMVNELDCDPASVYKISSKNLSDAKVYEPNVQPSSRFPTSLLAKRLLSK